MCDLIKIMNTSDFLNGTNSRITTSLDEILSEINKNKNIIIELPWQSDISGQYLEKIQINTLKIENNRIYFINPIKLKVPLFPYEIKEIHKKGFPRILYEDKTESISIDFLKKLETENNLRGIISN